MTSAAARPRSGMSISTRLTLIFLPLGIIPLLVFGAAAYLRAQDLIRAQAVSRLSSAVVANSQVVQGWLHAREDRVNLAAQAAALRGPVAEVLADPLSPAGRNAMRSQLDSILSSGEVPLYTSVMLVRADDMRVLLSTDRSRENRVATSFQDGTVPLGGPATTPRFDDATFGPSDFVLLFSSPVKSSGDEVDAYLVGTASGTRLLEMLRQLQGFWPKPGAFAESVGQAYLAASPDLVLRSPAFLFATEPEILPGMTHPVFAFMQESDSGTAEYPSFETEQVVGSYQWLPEQGMGLLLEVPAAEVYAGLGALAPFFAGIMALTILAVLVIVPLATRQALRPLTSLTQLVERIARGQFEQRLPVRRLDEVGRLAESFNTMASELSAMYRSLEDRVALRTHQIRTASEVARDAAFIRDVDTLLDEVVHLISDRFGFYHVAIYLTQGDDAVLRATSSEGGARMLARGHSLPVGKIGLVGYVTGTGKPRIALDVGADAVHFASPDLPHTRSEVCLPLRVREQIIGALDVQSNEQAAFDDNDVVVLQTMADQLATALENARLVDSLTRQSTDRQRIIELYAGLAQQPSYDDLLIQITSEICRAMGFRRALLGILEGEELVIRSVADDQDPDPPERGMVMPQSQGLLGRAIGLGDLVQQPDPEMGAQQVTMAVPLVAAGKTIGALAVTRRGFSEAPAEDQELLRLLAGPLAAAVENARLAEESHRSLNELDSLYRQQASDAWQQLLRGRQAPGSEGTYQPGAGPGGGESEMVAPIEVRGEVIGALDISGRAGAELDREDEIILEAVAEELASALEQARLMEEIRRRAVQLQAAAEISRETTSQLDSATLLTRAVSLLHDRFGYDQVAVYRLDWQTSTAVVQAAAGIGAEALLADAHSIPIASKTVLGYVLQGGNAYAASDDAEDPYFHVTPYLPEARCELGLPLMIGDQVFGAILIRHSQPGAFSRDDITVLEVLADQIAVGVQNARLFEATLRRAQREQAVIEITGKIRTSGGIDGILRTAVREMRQAMGARQAQIWLNAPTPPVSDGEGGNGEGRT